MECSEPFPFVLRKMYWVHLNRIHIIPPSIAMMVVTTIEITEEIGTIKIEDMTIGIMTHITKTTEAAIIILAIIETDTMTIMLHHPTIINLHIIIVVMAAVVLLFKAKCQMNLRLLHQESHLHQ